MNFCPVTVHSIDTWLRLSYKQLVFHIDLYLYRFYVLKIVTFNTLPCFVQPKSSNASFSFSSLKLQSKSTHGFCHFIKCTIRLFHHHRHKHHYYQKKFLATVMSSLSIELSAVTVPVSCRSAVSFDRSELAISPHCVLQFFCILHFCHTCSLCRVELVVQFPARGSAQVLLCLFPGVLWLWHFLYSVGPHPVSGLHINTFVVSRAFMAGAASQAGDADSSRAPGLTSGLQGSVNVQRGTLLLVPQWQCISSFVFYIAVDILSPFHWSPTNVQCLLSSQKECVFTALNINTIALITVYVCTRQPVTHWPHYPRSDDENMTSEWHCNNAADGR